MLLNVLPTQYPVLGGFGKGVPGSISINFGLSGGKNCDKACRHHPDTTSDNPTHACYAVRVEIRPDRQGLLNKLKRHEQAGAVRVAKRALKEIQHLIKSGTKIPWVRFNTAGSFPQPRDASLTFLNIMRELLELLDQNNIPVHAPVETKEKAEFYRKEFGWRVVIRESAQSTKRFLTGRTPMTMVAGEGDMSRKERIKSSKLMAEMRFERTGRRTFVCPAVSASFLYREADNSKAKCGSCTLCAQPGVDVIYPLH